MKSKFMRGTSRSTAAGKIVRRKLRSCQSIAVDHFISDLKCDVDRFYVVDREGKILSRHTRRTDAENTAVKISREGA